MLNSKQAPTKMGSVQHMMNKMLLVVGAVFFTLVIVSATGATIFVNSNEPWYISLVNQTMKQTGVESDRCGTLALCGTPALDWFGFFLTFIVLYNNSVPISLMVTVEVINMVQGILIGKDVNMYYEENNTPALTRSSSLAQEIGQIEYIFSDKTGTLTCNKMEFKCAYINGKVYGDAEANEFDNTEYLRDVEESTNEKKKEALNLFRIVLGVAHTIVAETNEKTGEIEYQAESPDEAALVSAAKEMECTFFRRNNQTIFVKDKNGQEQAYHIYGLNQFNSTRKRMSVVVGTPDGRYLLLCKGADNVICERAVQDGSSEGLAKQLDIFAEQGLRTLVIAYRELSQEAATQWAEDFHAAEVSMTDRARLHAEVAEKIEKDLVIVGATAIEDKLQDGVPQCIADLREASIKLWVLTGDKLETAINIGA